MTTTSLKLSDDLKKRAASAARELGVSPHAFMVAAIEQAAIANEQRLDFVNAAKAARQEMTASGEGLDAREVHAYLKAKVAGNTTAKPKARAWQA